jgi:hypothetical protein
MSTQGKYSVTRRTALAGLSAGGLGLTLVASTRRASAQEVPTDLASHPVVGLWSLASGPGAPRAINAMHGDGTFTGLNSFGGLGLGAWEPTGERSIRTVLTFYNIAQVPGEFVEGTGTITSSLTVDEAGTTMAEESIIDIRDADGAQVANFPATGTFTRMTLDAPPAMGTPEAGTPVT